jgi:hypothetical protein
MKWDSEDESEDSELSSENFDYLTDNLTKLMEKVAKGYTQSTVWIGDVSNFGWRGLDGSKTFKATDGKELLREVLPDTNCYFNIYRGRHTIRIQNFHHDSPMGKEWYYIRPTTTKEAERYWRIH